MEENILLTNNEPVNETPKRPQFLSVICVLSFIFSGLAILFLIVAIFGVLAAEKAGISLTEKMAEMGNDQASIDATASALSIPSLSISILLTIISLVSVIMMWKLNKKGFFFKIDNFADAIAVIQKPYPKL